MVGRACDADELEVDNIRSEGGEGRVLYLLWVIVDLGGEVTEGEILGESLTDAGEGGIAITGGGDALSV